MIKLPVALEKVTGALAPAFTKPTHARVCVLLTAAILTVGSRTISNILRTAGDGGFATHDLAHFAKRHHQQLTLVSRFYANANLHAAPPQPKGKKNGRPRKTGHKLATPEEVVNQSGKRRKLTVAWYGGGQRKVEVITGTGHWYQAGTGLVEIRWVFVHDLTGTHRDDYFFTTDFSLFVRIRNPP